MTQQSQNMWNVILNILLLINKKWRQQLGREVKKSVLVKWVEGTRWRAKEKWQHPQTLPMLQVATSLYLGSQSPKKVGSEQVAQLMKTNPKKRPRQSFKSAQCRELRMLRYFLGEKSFRWNALQGIHWEKRENCKEGVLKDNLQ